MKSLRRQVVRKLYIDKSALIIKMGFSFEGLSMSAMEAHFYNVVRNLYRKTIWCGND